MLLQEVSHTRPFGGLGVSGVKVVAVSGMDGMKVVDDILTASFGDGVTKFPVEPLTDTELDEIVEAFPELKGLTSNPQSRELLRRLVGSRPVKWCKSASSC